MTGRSARARRFRVPPGEWARQNIDKVVILGMIVIILVVCCNLLAWPTAIWQTVGHDCGAVSATEGAISSGATQTETCLAQAYQHCSAATLSVSLEFSIDNYANYRFVIEPYGFTCAVEARWSRVHPFPPIGDPEIGYCDSVRLVSSGLRVLGCQTIGNVFVPGGA